MQSRLCHVKLAVGLACLLQGSWSTSGCATKRPVNGVEITREMGGMIVVGKTSMAEVLKSFGYGGLNPPTLRSESPRGICFTWEMVSGAHSGLNFGRRIHSESTIGWGDARGFCVYFDQDGVARASTFFRDASVERVHDEALKWLQGCETRMSPKERSR